MKALILTAIFLSAFFAGCLGDLTGENKAKCAEQLSACQKNCDNQGYLFANDIEECKSRCSRDYETCMGG